MLVKIILPHFLITKMSKSDLPMPVIQFENNSDLVMKRRMIPVYFKIYCIKLTTYQNQQINFVVVVFEGKCSSVFAA